MARAATALRTSTTERVSVLETKVDNIDEKLVDLKADVKDMHDCLDRTRDDIIDKLKDMNDNYERSRDSYYKKMDQVAADQTAQHNELADKIKDLEGIKNKFMMYAMVVLAFLAGAGMLGHMDAGKLFKILGL